MMTRSEFEAFLARTVWRTGDEPFEADLKYLISMGEARLQRDLKVVDRISAAVVGSRVSTLPLPVDFYSVITLADKDGPLKAVSDVYFARLTHPASKKSSRGYNRVYLTFNGALVDYSGDIVQAGLTLNGVPLTLGSVPLTLGIQADPLPQPQLLGLANKGIRLGYGPDTADPTAPIAEYDLEYTTVLPAFTDEPTWVQTDYWDIYVHACLIHTAPYLREDPRSQVWRDFYTEALEGILSDDNYRRYPGQDLRVRPSGVVA